MSTGGATTKKSEVERKAKRMTREDITVLFPDATKEQIDALLNKNSADIGRAKKLPSDYETIKEKAEKYDALENGKLSDEEKIKKALEDAEAMKKQAKMDLNLVKAKTVFVEAGFTKEEIEKVIGNVLNEDEQKTIDNANELVALFKQREESVTQRVKSELYANDPKPRGQKAADSSETKSKAETVAEMLAEKAAAETGASQKSRDYYFGG